MSEVIIIPHNKRIECVFGIEAVIVNNRANWTSLECFCFSGRHRNRNFRDRLRSDCKFYVELATGDVCENILDKAEVIFLEPDFTEIILDVERDGHGVEFTHPKRSEPKIENIRAQH